MNGARLPVLSRTRVVVIGGGQSGEHAVSLATAASVAGGLDRQQFDVTALTIDLQGRWRDDRGTPLVGGMAEAVAIMGRADVIFPAVHGAHGEDGTLAGVCELASVPYVGSDVRAGALAMDKWVTKLIAADLGICTAPGIVITEATTRAAMATLKLPVVVKPVAGGSSHGVSRVDHRDEMATALRAALALDQRALIEQLVHGREIDIAVLERSDGNRIVGPPLEIVVGGGALFDTGRKYDGSADFRVPADVTKIQRTSLECAALALFDAIGCAGVARFDFFVTDDAVVLNEVNTMPGLTEQSQVPKMFAAIGVTYAELLEELVGAALVRATTA